MVGHLPSPAVSTPGYDALWLYFGLSYSSWITMPRAFMHEMPDEWQAKMAVLLTEWDEHWDWSKDPDTADLETTVAFKRNGKFSQMADWICNYRRPAVSRILACRRSS